MTEVDYIIVLACIVFGVMSLFVFISSCNANKVGTAVSGFICTIACVVVALSIGYKNNESKITEVSCENVTFGQYLKLKNPCNIRSFFALFEFSA